MPNAPRAITFLAPFVLTLLPRLADAEPVTFAFDIQIQQRCVGSACSVYSADFPLYVTIDRAGRGGSLGREYGTPTFSAIPLDRPQVPRGAVTTALAVDELIFDDVYKWRRVADMESHSELRTDEADFQWYTVMYRSQDYVLPLPGLTAASLAEFLGSNRGAGFFAYTYFGVLTGGGLTPDGISYQGIASLADAEPVPEPSSLLLIGSGLLAVLRRRVQARATPATATERFSGGL